MPAAAAAAGAAASAAAQAAAAAAAALPACGDSPSGSCLRQQAAALHAWGVSIRRELHRHPELMYEEQRTSALVQEVLSGLGIRYTAGWGRDRRNSVVEEAFLDADTLRGDAEELQQLLQQQQRQQQQQQQQQQGGTGVVAEIGTGEGPCVLLRADMDALPILEEAAVEYRSKEEGKMHACGHDAHTAMLLMAAAILKQNEKALKGTVRLVFQPAEEGGAGAAMMLQDGLLDIHPKPQLALGLHVMPHLPTGLLASREGPLMAATANFHFAILGLGGHAAMPAEAVDPIAACAAAVNNVHAMVARENDFGTSSSGFISFTQIQARKAGEDDGAGSAYNVIPGECTLKGTVRAFSLEKLHALQRRLREVTQKTAESLRCRLEVRRLHTVTPALVVDAHALSIFKRAAEEIGEEKVEEAAATFGGEDFAFVLQRLPGVFVFLGIGSGDRNPTNPIKTSHALHHPKFAVDEEALKIGAAAEAQFAFSAIHALLQQQQQQQQPQQQQHGAAAAASTAAATATAAAAAAVVAAAIWKLIRSQPAAEEEQ
ncbi:hypothetical protein Efla_006840 [Eimeria flavescens]